MARKKNEGLFEMIVELAARLPWWIGVLLAIIFYLVLHHYATATVAPTASVAQLGASFTSQLVKALSMFLQYLIPAACLLGAALSVYQRHKRAALLRSAQNNLSIATVNEMSWQEFELLVGEAFRRAGYTVMENGGGGADGGVDLVLQKDGEKFLVQCKQWRAFSVGVAVIRELYGVMAAEGAAGGFVVTSGSFTDEAKAFAKGRNVDLIDGAELLEIIRRVGPDARWQQTIAEAGAAATVPNCPNCGTAMVIRVAKKGKNTGSVFWGCSNYPDCKSTLSIG